MVRTKSAKKPVLVKRRKRKVKVVRRRPEFGAVTRVNTAPIAIGNSVRGCKSMVTPIPNGVMVCGRDFCFAPIGSGSVTTWTLVGGTPLTPAAFSDAVLRQYMQMYQKFRWRRLTAHYITSSPTSANGDILFYRNKQRDSVFLSQTSTQLLPFVISDPDTVLGPQWTNHSCSMTVSSVWKSTDYGMTASANDYSDGELFLLSKTSTTDSPGYVIFDYEIEFAEMQISPRLLTLPLTRAQYFQTNLGIGAATATAGASVMALAPTGNNISSTAATYPSGYTAGDIYKVIFDITNSATGSWTGVTTSTAFRVRDVSGVATSASDINLTLVDGMTMYAILNSQGNFCFCNTLDGAYAGLQTIYYGASGSGTITFNIQCWLSLVGSLNTTNLIPNF